MILMICGHPRSGTTLLQTLCDSHPEMGVTNELGNLTVLNQSYLTYTRHLLDRWRRVQGKWAFDVAYAHQSNRLALNNLRFVGRHLATIWQTYGGAVTAVTVEAAYRRAFPQASIVGDKWPHYLFNMDKFVAEPDVKRLAIYRDGRDVTSSFLKQARTTWQHMDWVGNVDTAEKIARRWVLSIELMEQHADRLHIMRYEELMQQPVQELTRLADWLAIDPAGFDAGMIKPTSIGKYQNGLTAEELDTVRAVAGPTLARLHYP
jgi:hypothetical protein